MAKRCPQEAEKEVLKKIREGPRVSEVAKAYVIKGRCKYKLRPKRRE
jgi:hypothetical protein